MKPVIPAVFFLVLALPVLSQTATPAPRPRLQPDPSPEAQQPGMAAASAPAIPMDRYIVRQGKLPAEPAQPVQPEGPFTLLEGGRLFQSAKHGSVVELGLWPWDDILKESAKFKPNRTRVDMDAVRVRW